MQLGKFTRVLLCGSALLSMSATVQAQQATQLDLITVTVNKIKQALSQAVGGVSVGTKKDLNLYGQNSVQQIVSGMPGVAGLQNANDPAQAINIRGLQDFGRVAVTIDGARQNFQRSGHNSNGTFYFEPEQMQQVTVTRGPIANVYGSGAIGGVVSFDTLDALSFLKQGENMALSEKLGYTSNGSSVLTNTTGAVRFGDWGGMIGNFVYRDNGTSVDGNGNNITSSARKVKSGMVKTTLTPSDEARIDLSYVVNNNTFRTPAISPSTTQYENNVTAQTAAAKLNYKPKDNALIDFTGSAYWTSTDQDQTVVVGSVANLGRHRDFAINTIGTDIYNTSRFDAGSMKHAVTLGADVFQDNVKIADGTTSPVAGKYTPSGTRTAGGAFIQDIIDVNPWLQLNVAGRFDGYNLRGTATPTVGAPFTVDVTGSHFSPKATVVLKPFENAGVNFYGTYAEGYRSPAVTETLVSGQHPTSTFAPFNFLPNPNLRPETSHNLEAGINGKWDNVLRTDDRVTFRGSVYQNMVDDYIDAVYTDPLGDTNPNVFPPTGYTDDTYQFVNIGRAKLRGIEAEIGYDSPFLFGGIAGSVIRGNNDISGAYLVSIPADKIVTTLGFHFDDQKGSIGARWFAVAAQTLVPPSTSATTSPPMSNAYNLVNLFASYTVNDNLNIGLNFDNIFNVNYRPYMDGSNATGRSVMLTVTTRIGK